MFVQKSDNLFTKLGTINEYLKKSILIEFKFLMKWHLTTHTQVSSCLELINLSMSVKVLTLKCFHWF